MERGFVNKIISYLLLVISLSFMIHGIQYHGSQTYLAQNFQTNLEVYPYEKVSLTVLSNYNAPVNISINGQIHTLKKGEILLLNSSSQYEVYNINTSKGLFMLEITTIPNLTIKYLYEFIGFAVFFTIFSSMFYKNTHILKDKLKKVK